MFWRAKGESSYRFLWPFYFALCLAPLSVAKPSSLPSKPDLTLAFSYDRLAKYKPCGCEIITLGGVNREFNLAKKWNAAKDEKPSSSILWLSSGVTFIPEAQEIKLAEISKRHLEEATKMVLSLNELGAFAVALSVEDFLLGTFNLMNLEKKAKFAFLSANLLSKVTGQPLFSGYKEWRLKKGYRVIVIGLSEEPDPYFPLLKDEEVQYSDPAKSLSTLLKQIPSSQDKTLFVVLSNLAKDNKRKLVSQFPQINVWLGGWEGDDGNYWRQTSKRSVMASAEPMGRAVLRLDLDLKDFFVQNLLFSKDVTKLTEKRLITLRADMKANTDRLGQGGANQKQKIREEIELLKAEETQLLTVSFPPASEPRQNFRFSTYRLLSDLDRPKNSIEKIFSLKDLKSELRK